MNKHNIDNQAVTYHFNFTFICIIVAADSYISKIAPLRFRSTLMGLIWGAHSFSQAINGQIGRIADPTVFGMSLVFKILFIVTLAIGIFFLLITKKMNHLTHGAEKIET